MSSARRRIGSHDNSAVAGADTGVGRCAAVDACRTEDACGTEDPARQRGFPFGDQLTATDGTQVFVAVDTSTIALGPNNVDPSPLPVIDTVSNRMRRAY